MKMLLIANKGILEPAALTLLGASTKRGDISKIGQFGSGNKYTLAYLLKHGYDVEIFSGQEQITIGIVKEVFREHEFEVLVINGQKTSITLEFGYGWSLWQAIRELYSNAVDEGLLYFGFCELAEGDPGFSDEFNAAIRDKLDTTRIYLKATPELEDFMFNLKDYIARDNELLFECPEGKIYRKHNSKTCIYFRGIRCYETTKESIYDYDFHSVDIGEDRLIKYSWGLPEAMWKVLFKCKDPVIIRTLLQEIQNPKFIENTIDGDFVTIPDMANKEEWKESLKGQSIVPRDLGGYVKDEDRAATLFLPGKLYTSLIGNIGNGLKSKSFTISKGRTLFHTIRLDEMQQAILDAAKRFFTECGYSSPLDHPIITVQFDNKSTMGSISEENEILISDLAIGEGVQYVISTIIEEHIHIKSRAKDCSREFQNAAITEFINYMKDKNTYTI